MSIIETIPESAAAGPVAQLYADDLKAMGYVPSHTRAMALNPEALAAWRALQAAIAGSLGVRRYELVTLAAARGLGSAACLLAHGLKALKFMPAEQLERVARDYRTAGLPAGEVAMMDFALKLSTASATMDDADSQSLRDAGFSDREIVDIALAAAARNYFSRALHALAVDVDVPAGLAPGLQDALLAPVGGAGRPALPAAAGPAAAGT
ncbi:carboxymuconolactone decarboxylase family protein [Arthrobacter sp. A2-55]|uniref:carboxymuconolactone decarboxylase family protein n=1 Tax=Arthrobacter sp. A2-55 TaxID=2897337 RepID=UPI0021CDE6BD|nr:carboxymuconolactone decarboxylase family protein [Arthrobacter sp. A2-55]MCU6481253.1 carboxymuconolactone decarboxylase family protein [Arthrobacter sp. A2-55]